MDDAEAVGAANDAFYLAFEKRDLLRMRACWRGHPDDVCIHPGWEVTRGKKIMESWRDIFATGMPMRFVISPTPIASSTTASPFSIDSTPKTLTGSNTCREISLVTDTTHPT